MLYYATMPALPSVESLTGYLNVLLGVLGVALAALWLALAIWAARDLRSRSRSIAAAVLVFLLVLVLPIVGLVIYLLLRPRETLAAAYDRALEQEALLQQIEERPACPGCSRTIDSRWMVCPHCHTRLREPCPTCSSLLELQWDLCPYCGTIVRAEPVEAAVPAAAYDAAEPLPDDDTQPTLRV